MRIAGGAFRGRALASPPEGVLRPTQDAVREAVFSMLAAVVPGCAFLDLYAGTGAVGLEALSRGAAAVAWVEESPRALRCLRRNVEAVTARLPVPPQSLSVVQADVAAFLRSPRQAPRPFDVVFADPPYVAREGDRDGMDETIAALTASGLLAPRSFFVAEQRAKTPPPSVPGWETLAVRRYGRTQVALLRRDAPAAAPDSAPDSRPEANG